MLSIEPHQRLSAEEKWRIDKHVQTSVHQQVVDFSGPTKLKAKPASSKATTLVEPRFNNGFQGIAIVDVKLLAQVTPAFRSSCDNGRDDF